MTSTSSSATWLTTEDNFIFRAPGEACCCPSLGGSKYRVQPEGVEDAGTEKVAVGLKTRLALLALVLVGVLAGAAFLFMVDPSGGGSSNAETPTFAPPPSPPVG